MGQQYSRLTTQPAISPSSSGGSASGGSASGPGQCANLAGPAAPNGSGDAVLFPEVESDGSVASSSSSDETMEDQATAAAAPVGPPPVLLPAHFTPSMSKMSVCEIAGLGTSDLYDESIPIDEMQSPVQMPRSWRANHPYFKMPGSSQSDAKKSESEEPGGNLKRGAESDPATAPSVSELIPLKKTAGDAPADAEKEGDEEKETNLTESEEGFLLDILASDESIEVVGGKGEAEEDEAEKFDFLDDQILHLATSTPSGGFINVKVALQEAAGADTNPVPDQEAPAQDGLTTAAAATDVAVEPTGSTTNEKSSYNS